MTDTEKTVRKFMSEAMPFTYKANNDGRLMTNLANFYDWLKQNEALAISDVVGRSEQLKAEVFTLANKLAISGEGDAAVAMHRIHNRL